MDARDGREERPEAPLSERPPYSVSGALRGDWLVLLLFALDAAFGLAVRPRLPQRVPMHWGADGKVDGWGSPWEAILLPPVIALFAYGLLLLVPLLDPRRASYALFGETLRVFRTALVAFILGVHAATLMEPLGVPISTDRVVRVLLPLLFVVLGNRLGRLRHNWFFGIRVPWTLESEEVWTRTHRLAGRVWVVAGLVLVPAAFLPTKAGLAAMGVGFAVATILPIVYSWALFRRLSAAR